MQVQRQCHVWVTRIVINLVYSTMERRPRPSVNAFPEPSSPCPAAFMRPTEYSIHAIAIQARGWESPKPGKPGTSERISPLRPEFCVAMEHAGLKNRYWVLRHGRSIPNEAGLIVSHMSNGVLPIYGLAPLGLLQAEGAGALFLKELEVADISLDHVRIFASPFRRTLETAEVVVDSMSTLARPKPPIKYLEGLRERYFGPPLELQSHEHYPEIWAIDAIDPQVGPEGGESVADVAMRVSEAIVQMEAEVQGCGVLVVSHGDTLQILQTVVHAALTVMSSADNGTLGSHLADASIGPVLSRHREYALLTGELRRLT